MQKVGTYEVNVYKGAELIETAIWETDLPPGIIDKYYKGYRVEVKESKFKSKVKTKAELDEE